MPKPNTKPHFRQYEIRCKGFGTTPEMAEHHLDLEIALSNRWIKGNAEILSRELKWEETIKKYIVEANIKYTDNRYKYD